jgi:tetratricopeptide (TPR) repeat protein
MAELNLTLLQNIGTSYFSLNDYATAEQFCSKVIDVNPRHFKAHYRRALCLYELKRYEEAHESIKNAYAIDSTIG